jgi:glycosyltransferase involved in cell wall biosynthesis
VRKRIREVTVQTQTAENISIGNEPATKLCWHLITCEYPPQPGGVSDYTQEVAAGLASEGDGVHVWCPNKVGAGETRPIPGVVVHPDLGVIAPSDLANVGRQLDRFSAPRRILVQWVPHGYGYRSMNVAFCWWLRNRATRHGDKVEIMVHEPYLRFRAGSLRQSAAALVHRFMMILLLQAADRVYLSIPAWEDFCRPYALGRRLGFQWLPIPSTIPLADNPDRVRILNQRYAPGHSVLIGHFGTYNPLVTSILEPVLVALAGDPGSPAVLLMGQGSEAYRQALVGRHPGLSGLVRAAGSLDAEDLSCHVAACDLLFQPYPDGVSTRRTSCMLPLSHGKPVVTNLGALSETFWKDTDAVALAPTADVESLARLLRELASDQDRRARLGLAARKLYQDRFDISHTVAALRKPAGGQAVCES